MEVATLCAVVAFVRVFPSRSQFFNYESVTLSCELLGNSSGWRIKRNTSTNINEDCSSSRNGITEPNCVISDLYPSDGGIYWCESEAGECSNVVNITVTRGSVILESPVHPVMEGESVTLFCRNDDSHKFTTATFYKDEVLIGSSSTGNLTLNSISKSDEGFYKCNISGVGQSPDSRLMVRGEHKLIGPLDPIRAAQGEAVIPPCHLEFVLDLKPDHSDILSRVEYVHLYRDRKELSDMYVRMSELKHGNASLKIMNVTEANNRRFRSYNPKVWSKTKFTVVQLMVDPNKAKTSKTNSHFLEAPRLQKRSSSSS
ncbi:uncharacterized protein KZ484_006612 isoform 2-T2 [Pholidichthys leucotaenia]